ncbi:MAG: hypothetical protein ACI85O_002991 [Saprospiraceae bacterium]|jgi:hypothetical protein
MNLSIGSLLKNLWALIGSILSTFLYSAWFSADIGWEPFVGLVISIFVLIGSFYSYIFYRPFNVLRFEASHIGSSGKLPPSPPIYSCSGKNYGKTHLSTITWDYRFILKNKSAHIGYNVELHLLDKFSDVHFENLENRFPRWGQQVTTQYFGKINRLRKDEPIKPLETVTFSAKFIKQFLGTRYEALEETKPHFPVEISDFEFLIEYFTEDGDEFYTLFKKVGNNDWENKVSAYMPLKYTYFGRYLTKTWGILT